MAPVLILAFVPPLYITPYSLRRCSCHRPRFHSWALPWTHLRLLAQFLHRYPHIFGFSSFISGALNLLTTWQIASYYPVCDSRVSCSPLHNGILVIRWYLIRYIPHRASAAFPSLRCSTNCSPISVHGAFYVLVDYTSHLLDQQRGQVIPSYLRMCNNFSAILMVGF